MLLLAVFLACLCGQSQASQPQPDQLCIASNCPVNTTCQVEEICSTPLKCTYEAMCFAKSAMHDACPNNTFTDNEHCVRSCSNDTDCQNADICCPHGCGQKCVHPCTNVICPSMYYCHREQSEFCIEPQMCYQVGDCVPCPLPNCATRCDYGYAQEPNGCPGCDCKPGAAVSITPSLTLVILAVVTLAHMMW